MKTELFAFSALFALTAFAPVTLADQVNFSFNGGGISSSGAFTVSATSTPGYEAITGISGTFTDTTDGISGIITGLYKPISYTAPPVGSPASTGAGISYDDTFYPGADSPNNCSDYPFYGGVFDVYGVAFNVAGGYVGALWSDGNMPGAGLVYAAGDSNATTLLDLPNPDGSNQTLPVGVPGALVTNTAAPEPASLFMFGMGLLGLPAMWALKLKRKGV
jgi:hypothetical protein